MNICDEAMSTRLKAWWFPTEVFTPDVEAASAQFMNILHCGDQETFALVTEYPNDLESFAWISVPSYDRRLGVRMLNQLS